MRARPIAARCCSRSRQCQRRAARAPSCALPAAPGALQRLPVRPRSRRTRQHSTHTGKTSMGVATDNHRDAERSERSFRSHALPLQQGSCQYESSRFRAILRRQVVGCAVTLGSACPLRTTATVWRSTPDLHPLPCSTQLSQTSGTLAPALAVLTAMITPAILVLAAGTLIGSTSTRLGRVVDCVRALSDSFEALETGETKSASLEERRVHIFGQLNGLTRRARLLQLSMLTLYLALASFVSTSVVLGLAGVREARGKVLAVHPGHRRARRYGVLVRGQHAADCRSPRRHLRRARRDAVHHEARSQAGARRARRGGTAREAVSAGEGMIVKESLVARGPDTRGGGRTRSSRSARATRATRRARPRRPAIRTSPMPR